MKKAQQYFHQSSSQGHFMSRYWIAKIMEKTENQKAALDIYHQLAEQGHVQSQYKLGQMYESGGVDIQKNGILAIDWYSKAVVQNHPKAILALKTLANLYPDDLTNHVACWNMAEHYKANQYKNRGDLQKALFWYEKSGEYNKELVTTDINLIKANLKRQDGLSSLSLKELQQMQPSPTVDYEIGFRYETGFEVKQDALKAKEYYDKLFTVEGKAFIKELAEREDPHACFVWGRICYLEGNIEGALPYLRKAATKYHKFALYTLGQLYYEHKEYPLAYRCFIRADQYNVSLSWYYLGRMNYEGQSIPVDLDEAHQYLTLAANRCHDREAQYLLANMYAEGEGRSIDLSEAMLWYLKAADQNHVEAMVQLGRLYDNGTSPIKKDKNKSLDWYKKAANLGHLGAQSVIEKFAENLKNPFLSVLFTI